MASPFNITNAAGTTAGTAAPIWGDTASGIFSSVYTVTTATATGIILPSLGSIQVPTQVFVFNASGTGTTTLLIYPPTNGTLNGGTSTVSVAAGASVLLIAYSPLDWISVTVP